MPAGLVWFVDRHWLWMNPTCQTSMWAWKISRCVCKCGPRVEDWSRPSPPWSSSIRWNRMYFFVSSTRDPLILLETSCWVLDFCWIHCLNFSLSCFRGHLLSFFFWEVMPVAITVVVDGLLVFLYLNGREALDQPKRLSDYAAEAWRPGLLKTVLWASQNAEGEQIAARCRLEISSLGVLPRRLKQSKEVMWHGRSGNLRVACVLGGIKCETCRFGLLIHRIWVRFS